MSTVISKGILNWKHNRTTECQSFGCFHKMSIVVSNAVLPGLVFSAFWVLVNGLPLFCICGK